MIISNEQQQKRLLSVRCQHCTWATVEL